MIFNTGDHWSCGEDRLQVVGHGILHLLCTAYLQQHYTWSVTMLLGTCTRKVHHVRACSCYICRLVSNWILTYGPLHRVTSGQSHFFVISKFTFQNSLRILYISYVVVDLWNLVWLTYTGCWLFMCSDWITWSSKSLCGGILEQNKQDHWYKCLISSLAQKLYQGKWEQRKRRVTVGMLFVTKALNLYGLCCGQLGSEIQQTVNLFQEECPRVTEHLICCILK